MPVQILLDFWTEQYGEEQEEEPVPDEHDEMENDSGSNAPGTTSQLDSESCEAIPSTSHQDEDEHEDDASQSDTSSQHEDEINEEHRDTEKVGPNAINIAFSIVETCLAQICKYIHVLYLPFQTLHVH